MKSPALLMSFVLVSCAASWTAPAQAADLQTLVEEGFEQGADRWQPTDPSAWQVDEREGGHVFSLTKKQSKYSPPFRSPLNIALLREPVVADLELTVRLKSTEADYGHRSLCLFLGYQDPAHFYYVHLGKTTDDHANQIFIVNEAARRKISTKTTPGTPWDDAWHTVKIVRRVESGQMDVYFDDLTTSIMTALDKTFLWGQVGIGSFDDRGEFDDVQLLGTKVERPQ